MSEGAERFAAAKINLFLHVGPVADDGYHPVSSLMVFADVGDIVRLRPAPAMGFDLEGPFSAALGRDEGNLVLSARDRLLSALGVSPAPFHLALDKRLPIAAGLGGGSADAAAALRLIAEHMTRQGLPGADDALAAVARGLGADVAACLDSRPVIATGRGDVLSAGPALPPLDAVLVNPLAPSPTGAVYRAYDAIGPAASADTPALPDRLETIADVVAFLAGTRNDLQTPALRLQPLIGAVLAALGDHPESLWARMSGSGATCLALCTDAPAARRLAADLAATHPRWWIRPCRLGP